MRKRLVLVAIVVALAVWGILAFTAGASTLTVRWHGGSAETELPGLEHGPAAEPRAELRFAPSAEDARKSTVPGEATVYDNVMVYGRIRDSELIRSCLRES